MKKVLITGCSGFLASHLVTEYQNENAAVYGITEDAGFSSDRFDVFHCDIREGDALAGIIETVSPDIIFHLAAISNVGFSWKEPGLTYGVNFIGSSNLLEGASLYAGNARVIMMSSAEVYAGRSEGRLSEDSPVSPDNPYALSKMAMELAADIYTAAERLDIVKVRGFNFTGPGQSIVFVSSDFAAQIARIERGQKEPVIRAGNLSAKRDFSDVRDIARYLRGIAGSGRTGEVYNLCSGQVYAISDILDILLELAEKEIRVEIDRERFRPVDKPVLYGDNSRIRDELGLTPAFGIRQTLSDLLDHHRSLL